MLDDGDLSEPLKKGGEVTKLWLKYQREKPFPPPIVKVNSDGRFGVASLKLEHARILRWISNVHGQQIITEVTWITVRSDTAELPGTQRNPLNADYPYS